jgi:ribonuclease HI
MKCRPHQYPALFDDEERQAGPGGADAKTTPNRRDMFVCYTDGSTGKTKGLLSGSSVVHAGEDGTTGATHGFAVRTSGNNYLAELVAYAASLIMTPAGTDNLTWSDALSVKHAVERGRDRGADGGWLGSYHLTQIQRILSAARPVMNVVRAMIAARAGQSRIEHVGAHTGGLDVHSRLNEAADAEANNRARVSAKEGDKYVPYQLVGEERVCSQYRKLL